MDVPSENTKCLMVICNSLSSTARDDMSTDALNATVTPPIVIRSPLFEQEGARGVAVRSLLRIESSALDAERIIRKELAAHPDWNEFEAALYQELVLGTLRWRAKLDWVLTGFYHGEFPKCMPVIQETLRVALYQILMISKVPPQAAIDAAGRIIERIKGDDYATKLCGILRNIARNVAGIRYPPREQLALHMSVVHSHPLWLVERWLDRYGEEITEQMLVANLERPPLYLAANHHRLTDEGFHQWLQQNGHIFDISPLCSRVVRLNPFTNVVALTIWQQGSCYVTDPLYALAASLVFQTLPLRVLYVAPEPTIALYPLGELAQLHNAQLSVWSAFDQLPDWIEQEWARLGWAQPTLVHGDNMLLYDAICLEVPSSGIGQWRRKPWLKWRTDVWDIRQAAVRARQYLDRVASHVADGGMLVLLSASIEPEETRLLAEWFVTVHPEFELVPIASEQVTASLRQSDGTLQALPHHHRSDSIFVALFVKRS